MSVAQYPNCKYQDDVVRMKLNSKVWHYVVINGDQWLPLRHFEQCSSSSDEHEEVRLLSLPY